MPPAEAPIPEGTAVVLDEDAEFIDRDLVAGGSPWRLLRLRGPSRTVAEKWRGGGVVGAGEERFARTLVQQGLLHPHFKAPKRLDSIDVVLADVRATATTLVTNFGDPLVAAVAPRVCGAGGPSWREKFEANCSPLD